LEGLLRDVEKSIEAKAWREMKEGDPSWFLLKRRLLDEDALSGGRVNKSISDTIAWRIPGQVWRTPNPSYLIPRRQSSSERSRRFYVFSTSRRPDGPLKDHTPASLQILVASKIINPTMFPLDSFQKR
jgi:hypothetical protein